MCACGQEHTGSRGYCDCVFVFMCACVCAFVCWYVCVLREQSQFFSFRLILHFQNIIVIFINNVLKCPKTL